jgi:hypothetical protein
LQPYGAANAANEKAFAAKRAAAGKQKAQRGNYGRRWLEQKRCKLQGFEVHSPPLRARKQKGEALRPQGGKAPKILPLAHSKAQGLEFFCKKIWKIEKKLLTFAALKFYKK